MTRRIPTFLRQQGITIALLAAIAAGILLPELGREAGPLAPAVTTQAAVAAIFLLQGLSLPTRQLLRSAADLRFHCFCQACIFLLAPALMLAFLTVFDTWLHASIGVAFFFLASVPTTIASAIVFTENSGGDRAAALFSTSLANALGVFITPALCAAYLSSVDLQAPPLAPTLAKLGALVLLPLAAGQAIRPFLRAKLERARPAFKPIANGLITFIVYIAFSQSVLAGAWKEQGLATILLILGLAFLFLVALSAAVYGLAQVVLADPSQRVAAFFCGSQKTLAAGIPMAAVLFSDSTLPISGSLGLIALPLLCYHALQLLLAGALAPRLRRRAAGRGSPRT